MKRIGEWYHGPKNESQHLLAVLDRAPQLSIRFFLRASLVLDMEANVINMITKFTTSR